MVILMCMLNILRFKEVGSGKNRLKHFENMQGKTKIKKAGGGEKEIVWERNYPEMEREKETGETDLKYEKRD